MISTHIIVQLYPPLVPFCAFFLLLGILCEDITPHTSIPLSSLLQMNVLLRTWKTPTRSLTQSIRPPHLHHRQPPPLRTNPPNLFLRFVKFPKSLPPFSFSIDHYDSYCPWENFLSLLFSPRHCRCYYFRIFILLSSYFFSVMLRPFGQYYSSKVLQGQSSLSGTDTSSVLRIFSSFPLKRKTAIYYPIN